jgi:Flp pilus assembly protein TadB
MKQQTQGSNRQIKRANRATPYTGSRRSRRAANRLASRIKSYEDTMRNLDHNPKAKAGYKKPGKIDIH